MAARATSCDAQTRELSRGRTALIERATARGELNGNIGLEMALDMIPSALLAHDCDEPLDEQS